MILRKLNHICELVIEMDKLIKENDTHVWRETESGMEYVYPKNTFWIFLEKQAEDFQKIENEFTKKYAETLRKIYAHESMDLSQIPTAERIQILDENNNPKWLSKEYKNDNDPAKDKEASESA